MALMRTYNLVKEGGKIYIPENFLKQIGLQINNPAVIGVVRIKRSIRAPHLVIHRKDNSPWISPQEVVINQGLSNVDREGNIILRDDILEDSKLKPGHLVEMKVYGPHNSSWLVIQNRGPKIETTLQQKMRKYRPGYKESQEKKGRKTWESILLDY